MKFWKTFDIEVIKFKEGLHEVVFPIEDAFFQQVEENELLEKGNLTARVKIDKGANLMELTFHIVGKVQLTCDRSLEVFDHELDITEKMIYKFGSEVKEIDESVMMITRDTPSINVAQLIYEYILLGLPLKKIHPDYKNELDEEDNGLEGGYVYVDGAATEDSEEETILKPAIQELKDAKQYVFGPYPADGFFGMMHQQKFDGVLALYHDQGLIPFKSIAFSSGVNFTAGLSVIRTSPDHGTAYAIAGKNTADCSSFRAALFLASDMVERHQAESE